MLYSKSTDDNMSTLEKNTTAGDLQLNYILQVFS